MRESRATPDGGLPVADLSVFATEPVPVAVGSEGVFVAFTERRHGDAVEILVGATQPAMSIRQHGTTAGRRTYPWAWLRQNHGATVVTVAPGDEPGQDGDALVSVHPVGLAVFVADCVPVLLASRQGVVAAVHCGWRGVVAGVVPAAVHSMRALGASNIHAAVGPCIGPQCYPFGVADLEKVEAALGPGAGVRAVTGLGEGSLDMRRAVRRALEAAGVEVVYEDDRCTACDSSLFSARARGDTARQAGLVWRAR